MVDVYCFIDDVQLGITWRVTWVVIWKSTWIAIDGCDKCNREKQHTEFVKFHFTALVKFMKWQSLQKKLICDTLNRTRRIKVNVGTPHRESSTENTRTVWLKRVLLDGLYARAYRLVSQWGGPIFYWYYCALRCARFLLFLSNLIIVFNNFSHAEIKLKNVFLTYCLDGHFLVLTFRFLLAKSKLKLTFKYSWPILDFSTCVVFS